jgi:protocatechuate 3,4-dioxygenase beta subunit
MRPTPSCEETSANAEGPFYTLGAPVKKTLYDPALGGTRLVVTGKVLGAESCTGLAGAAVDLWHADKDGAYDNVGFTYRGKFLCEAGGAFTLDTIVPGRYLNGGTYRPAHLHVKVSAPGHVLLTTQLYFEGDPYNVGDGLYLPELAMKLADGPNGEKLASFDFVLVAS